MGTNYIAPTWRQPENANKDRLSNYNIEFDGSRIQAPFTELSGATNCTISFWAKIDYSANAEAKYPFHLTNGTDNPILWIFPASGTALDIYIGNVNFRLDDSFNKDIAEWNHWVLRFDGSETSINRTRVYQNGQQLTSQSGWGTATSIPSATNLILAGRNLNATQWYYQMPGNMSQCCIFDYTLSEDQINYLYNLNNPMTISGAEPIAYYPLGDNSNPTANAGYPNIVSAADSVFDFDTADYVSIPHISVSSAFSVSAWVKTTDAGTYGNIFSSDEAPTGGTTRNWQVIRWNAAARFILRDSGGSAIADINGGTINDGNWHHVLATWDGTTGTNKVQIYVDGTSVAQGTASSTALANSAIPMVMSGSSATWDFIGDLSNIAIWNSDQSDNVADIYNNGLPLLELSEMPGEDSLQAWYKLNQSAVLTPGITALPWVVSIATGNPDYTNTDDGAYTFNGEFRCRDTGAYDFSDSFYLTFRTITGAHNNITLTSTGGYLQTDGGIRFEYRIDGGSWVQFQEVDGPDTDAWTFTPPSSVNCSTSYELRAQMHGSAYSGSYISLYDMTISASSGTLLTETFGQTNLTGASGGSISNPPPVTVSTDHWDIPDNRSAYPQSFNFNNNTTTPAPSFDTSFNPDGYTKLTFSIWAYAESYNNRGTFFATFEDTANKYSDSNFRISPSRNRFNVSINGDFICALNIGAAFQSITPNGVWNCITLVYDGTFTDADTAVQNAGRLKFYTNKVYKAFDTFTNDVPSSIISNSLGSRIGAASPTLSNGSSRSAFLGKLSNLQIWDTDLSSSEVATLYNNGVPLPTASVQPSSLKLWTRLDNSSKWNTTTSQWNIPTNPIIPIPSSISAIVKSSASSYIENTTPSGIDLTNPTTCSFWTKTTQADVAINSGSLGGGGDFAIIGNRILIFRSGTNYRYFDVNTTILNDNNWHNLILYTPGYASADIASTRLFMDGLELTASTTVSSGSPASVNNNPILGVGNVYADITEASFSNAVIWSSDQTANITEIYNNGTPASSYTENPVLWWELNNLTSGLDDLSGNGNNAVAVGPVFTVVEEDIIAYQLGVSLGMTEANLIDENVSVVNGESDTLPAAALVQSDLTRKQPFSNYSITFDGTDYISTNTLRLGNTYSISMWFNADSFPTTNPVLISQYTNGLAGRFFLGVRDDGGGRKITVFSGSHNYGSTVISTGSWYNVILVNNNNTVTLYLNGSVDGNFTFSSAPPDTDILIGALDTTPSNPWDGKISNVAYWSSSLTPEEILDVYNNGVPTNLNTSFTPSPPEYWWPMDEDHTYFNGSVIIARDAVGSTDATGVNIIQENIVGNAPGSTANGVGSNLTIASLKGDMLNSTNNSYSINMADYADGVTNPADSGRSTNVP